MAKTLRERCKEHYEKMGINAMLRQSSPVDDLEAFVLAERGRAADPALEQSLPLVLYFANEADRDEFEAIVREVKPNMMTKAMP